MRAIRLYEYGGPEVLRYEEVPTPEPGPGEVLVKIEAAGLNFIDIYNRSGQYPGPLPTGLGEEAAGTVEAIGPNVTEFKQGDRVAYAQKRGAYAEYAAVTESILVSVPDNISAHQAAAVMLQGLTAHYLALSTYPLKPGDTAVIQAAAGGLGLLLVQIAKMRGAKVIGTTSTEGKAALAKKAGADEMILYTKVEFDTEVRRLMNGTGVDVVYDSVGKTTFDQSLNCLRPRGYMILCGQSSAPVPPFNPQTLNAKGSLFLTRPTLRHYVSDRKELLWRASDLFQWMGEGKLDVRIDKTFPLSQAGAALEYLASRQSKGKILLIPGS